LNETFSTGAVFRLVDEFDGPLRRLIGGLESAEKKAVGLQGTLDKLGLGAVVTKMESQWEEISKISSAGVDKVIKSMARLGPDTGAVFGEMTKGAKASFGEIGTFASGLSGEVVEAMKGLKTGAIAEMQGIGAAAPEALGGVLTATVAMQSDVLAEMRATATGAIEALRGIGAEAPELFQPIASAATAAAEEAIGSIGRINEAIKASVAEMQGLSTEAAAVAARSSGAAAAATGVVPVSGSGLTPIVPRNPASPHNKAHGGFHLRPHHVAIPGGSLGASQGGDGMVPLVSGILTGEILKDALGKAFDFRHWETQFEAAGFSQSEVQKASKSAWANAAQNQNTSATENIGRLYEMIKVFPEFNGKKPTLDEAITFLPAFNNIMTGLQSVKSEGIHSKFSSGKQVFELAKGLEETGVTQRGTNEEREKNTKAMMSELFKTMLSERGVTDGSSFYAMTNNSGGAAQNWDMRMATVVAPILGSVMKHSKLGNADYMANRSYAAGIITSKSVANLVKYGLVDQDLASGKVWQDSKSQWHLDPNSQFAEGMSENIWDWSGGVLDKLKAHGVDTHNQKAVNQVINGIGSNKSTTMMMRGLLEPATRMQIVKDMALRDAVPDNAVDILQNKDPVLKLDALHKKTEDFLTALGTGLVDPAIAGLTGLTAGINAFAQAMEAHPDLTKVGAMGAGVAALGLTGYGAARMLGFGGGGAALSGAATALDASALALKEAAAALSGRALPGGGGAGPGGTSPGYTNLLPRAALTMFQLYELGKDMPDVLKKAETDNAPVDPALKREGAMGDAIRHYWKDHNPFDMGAHAAEGATIPGLNPSGITGQASAAIAGRLGVPAGIDMSGAIERATAGLGLLQKQEELNVWQFGQLTTSTGIVQTSFDGLNTRATGITGALASFSAALDAATAKVYGLFGGGSGAGAGDVGIGSGFTQAAYTTWDSTGGGSGSSGIHGSGHGASNAYVGGTGGDSARSMPSIRYGKPYSGSSGSLVDGPVSRFSAGGSFAQKSPEIMSRLMGDFSLDAPMAAKIMGNLGHESMGFKAFNEVGGGGGIGWAQWTGSRNHGFRDWSAANHLDPHSDEANYGFLKHELAGRYAGSVAGLKAGGSLEGFERSFEGAGVKAYGSRHAYERAALDAYSHRGATVSAGRPAATVSAPPPRKVSPGVPAGGAMTTAMNMPPVEVHLTHLLDGKVLTKTVTKHQAMAMRHPGNMGGPDPHSHYVSPGTPVTDAA